MNAPSQLRPDTQAVLLLCGHFSKGASEKPLTNAEYGRLAKWLHERGQRPASLMDMSLADLGRVIEAKLDPEQFIRIHRRFIVNIDRVHEVRPWLSGDAIVVMQSGSKLRLSRTHREAFYSIFAPGRRSAS